MITGRIAVTYSVPMGALAGIAAPAMAQNFQQSVLS
jgi:hypothetical protein